MDPDAAGEEPEFDPSNTALAGAYTARRSATTCETTLKWESDLSYPTSGNVRPWTWDEFENHYMDMSEQLRQAHGAQPVT